MDYTGLMNRFDQLAAELDLGGGADSIKDYGQPIQYSVMVLEDDRIVVYQTRNRMTMLDAVRAAATRRYQYTVYRRTVRPHE